MGLMIIEERSDKVCVIGGGCKVRSFDKESLVRSSLGFKIDTVLQGFE